MINEFNVLKHIQKQAVILDGLEVQVGITTNSGFFHMIAVVNNDGMVIYPKKHDYLYVPTKDGGFVKLKQAKIPARQFLEKTVGKRSRHWNKMMADGIAKMSSGDTSLNAMKIMNLVGKDAVKTMKDVMTEFYKPANAPLTIYNKGKDDPLIDTGALRDHITYRISERGWIDG